MNARPGDFSLGHNTIRCSSDGILSCNSDEFTRVQAKEALEWLKAAHKIITWAPNVGDSYTLGTPNYEYMRTNESNDIGRFMYVVTKPESRKGLTGFTSNPVYYPIGGTLVTLIPISIGCMLLEYVDNQVVFEKNSFLGNAKKIEMAMRWLEQALSFVDGLKKYIPEVGKKFCVSSWLDSYVYMRTTENMEFDNTPDHLFTCVCLDDGTLYSIKKHMRLFLDKEG